MGANMGEFFKSNSHSQLSHAILPLSKHLIGHFDVGDILILGSLACFIILLETNVLCV